MSAECSIHGTDLYWKTGEYNGPSGCTECDLEKVEEQLATVTAERYALAIEREELHEALLRAEAEVVKLREALAEVEKYARPTSAEWNIARRALASPEEPCDGCGHSLHNNYQCVAGCDCHYSMRELRADRSAGASPEETGGTDAR